MTTLVLLLSLVAHGSPLALPSDAETIRPTWAELDAAWAARDAERFSALFTPDASFVFVDRGHSMDGREAIRAHFIDQFPRIAQEYSHRTEITSVRSVADGTVLADGVVRVSRAGEAYRSFDLVAVMVRGDDGWDIAVLRVFDRP